MIIPQASGSNIFRKEEKVEVDKTQPFFINIYSDNNYDINNDFIEQELATNHQIHFYNKPYNNEENTVHDNFFITAKRSGKVDLFKNYIDTVEFKTNHEFGKWSFSEGVYQELIYGKNNYHNYLSFEPEYKINGRFSVLGGISHSLTDNHDQTKIGIKWTPVKFNRLEFKLSVSNYTKQFSSDRNRLNFETIFKM